jgi:hypothetical protein
VSSNAFPSLMGQITTISFEDALRLLQDLFRRPVSATVDCRDTLASCYLQGELTRIETLPPG